MSQFTNVLSRQKGIITDIAKVKFGIFSADEIKRMATCKLDKSDKEGPGTVYDELMGCTANQSRCTTCNLSIIECQGHFGYIELPVPIFHPLLIKQIEQILSCVCLKCYRLIVNPEFINKIITRIAGKLKFKNVVENLSKINVCYHCNTPQPDIKTVNEHTIVKIYDKNNAPVNLLATEALYVFENISDTDVIALGLDPRSSHPKNLILTALPVLPPCDRPFVTTNGMFWDDDLTNKYIEIIRRCNVLKDSCISKEKFEKNFSDLVFHVSTLMNNKNKKAVHSANGRPIKDIKDRISGKNGHIRGHLTGKRCDFTARTVAGPDPSLKFGQVAVPRDIANVLTIPVYVNASNIERMKKLMIQKKINNVIINEGRTSINIEKYRHGTYLLTGDVLIRDGKRIVVNDNNYRVQEGDQVERNGKLLKNVYPHDRVYDIKIGHIVERQLQDGDYVLMGRHPTLHRSSLQGMEVVVKPHKTIRVNLGITKPLNLDFDGDELNLHIPQSLKAQSELKHLACAKNNIISPQSSKSGIAIVQDALVSAYRMTLGVKRVSRSLFFDITCLLHKPPECGKPLNAKDDIMTPSYVLNKMNHIRRILKSKGKRVNAFTGHALISLALPSDLVYEKKNNANPEEPVVKVYRGVLYEGTLDKSVLGSAHNSLIQVINKEYGSDYASYFIDCIHFVCNEWLKHDGFSIGLGDCIINESKKKQDIKDVIQKCYVEAENIGKTTNHPGIRESRVSVALNKGKDVGLRIAKESFHNDNNFLSTVTSGSKGDMFNIAQITGLLGQQNVKGRRIPMLMNNGKRTLSHYPYEITDDEMKYESRGFISRSFIEGLTPRQLFFHAMSGREGVTDTALGTAVSGYMQRQLSKLMEDVKIHYDGTVRDGTNRVFQMSYGDNGLDPVHMIKVGKTIECCDVSRIVNRVTLARKIEKQKQRAKKEK